MKHWSKIQFHCRRQIAGLRVCLDGTARMYMTAFVGDTLVASAPETITHAAELLFSSPVETTYVVLHHERADGASYTLVDISPMLHS